MTQPNLLYITPIIPNATGSGLAMRAYHVAEALSSVYRIYILAPSIRPGGRSIDPSALPFCEKAASLAVEPRDEARLFLQHLLYKHARTVFEQCFRRPPEWVYVTKQRIQAAAHVFANIRFDVIHVYRLYMSPFAEPFLRPPFTGRSQLDLDDIESRTRNRLSDLYRLNGHAKTAISLRREAKIYESIEKRVLPSFDRIFVCSHRDREDIVLTHPCQRVEVLPNVVKIPPDSSFPRAKGPFAFLFVGTLGYYPNVDALLYFCNAILPLVRQRSSRNFIVRVVGRGLTEEIRRKLISIPGVNILGYVEDLAPVYLDSDAVVVPIRAGGGTRIKILEAFSYRKPVISTAMGLEGIQAQNRIHALVGDTPEEFACHCLELIADQGLAETLAGNALDLVKTYFTTAHLRQILHGGD